MIQIKRDDLEQTCRNFYEGTHKYFNYDICSDKEKLYLKRNLEKIITAKPNQYNKIITDFEESELNIDIIRKVFVGDSSYSSGYKKFSNKKTKNYNAYTLTSELKINVCPYCNRSYTFTIKCKSEKSARPELDHFICKKAHPILAMNFYNLIPSCNICNSSIKGQTEFNIEEYIHPYFDDFNQIKKFSINKSFLSILSSNDNFKIIFEDRKDIDPIKKKKADNHINAFALEALYQCHKDRVLELIETSRAYEKDSIDNLIRTFSKSTKIFKKEDDIKRLLFNYHTSDTDIEKRPLNKLLKDINEKIQELK